ncbi:MAG: hypothetical protein RIA71_12790 [Oceanicaulis sp.]
MGSTVALATACATPVERISSGGSDFEGVAGAHYVTIYRSGPQPVYATGSSFGAAEAPVHNASPTVRSVRDGGEGRVVVTGPETIAEPLASAVAEAMDTLPQWRGASDLLYALSITVADSGRVNAEERFTPDAPPWPLSFTTRLDQVDTAAERAQFAGTMTHEAFHLANAVALRGRSDPHFQDRPDLAWIYEETAALLIADCATLSVGQPVDLTTTPQVTLDVTSSTTGEKVAAEPPFEPRLINGLLTSLEQPHRRNSTPAAIIYIGFYRTIFEQVGGPGQAIEPESDAAGRLFEACETVGAEPAAVRDLLQPDRESEAERRARF